MTLKMNSFIAAMLTIAANLAFAENTVRLHQGELARSTRRGETFVCGPIPPLQIEMNRNCLVEVRMSGEVVNTMHFRYGPGVSMDRELCREMAPHFNAIRELRSAHSGPIEFYACYNYVGDYQLGLVTIPDPLEGSDSGNLYRFRSREGIESYSELTQCLEEMDRYNRVRF